MKHLLIFSLILLGACSFKKNQQENQTLKGHEELYSEPDAPSIPKLDEFEKRVIIAATNDVHGHYQTHDVAFKDDHVKNLQTVKIGGIDTIQTYFKILRDTYENVVLVDSGDIFARASSSNTVRDFYKTLDYDAVTVGLSDFNLKLPSNVGTSAELFKKFAKSSPTPLLLSNLYELKTARVVEWEGTKPYIVKNVGGVKVGIIGLIPDDIVAQTPVNNRVGLFVENMLQSTLRNARLLRSLGADIIVVLTHQGIDCNSALAHESKLPLMKVNFEPKRTSSCDLKGVLGTYLERLPHGLVDVVVGGRNHQKMANFVNGTLVLGGFPDGKSFSYAEFTINTKTKKVQTDATVVHQPVFFCHEFFKESKDCFTEDPSVDHKARIEATFLGKPIVVKPTAIEEKAEEKTSALNLKEIGKGLVTFTADIAYVPEHSGHTQMFVLAISGNDLLTVLEEDFNRGHKVAWVPSPFIQKGNELVLSIGGMNIERDKNYRILTDLESLQAHSKLIKNIGHQESESLANFSWNSFLSGEDIISSRLAAPGR